MRPSARIKRKALPVFGGVLGADEQTARRPYRVIERGIIQSFFEGPARIDDPIRQKPSTRAWTIGTAPSEVLQENPTRKYLLIQNVSASDINMAFGRAATAGDHVIPAGGSYEPSIAPVSLVSLVGAAADLAIVVSEGQ